MKKNVYICITEALTVPQKLTQHCKSTILQEKKRVNQKPHPKHAEHCPPLSQSSDYLKFNTSSLFLFHFHNFTSQ